MTTLKPEQVTKVIDTSTNMEEIKKNLFIVLEMLNGYTEEQAIRNWECENGQCQCP